MKYLSVKETAHKWGVSERTVQKYCVQGCVLDAYVIDKEWHIPETAVRPNIYKRSRVSNLVFLDCRCRSVSHLFK